MLELEDVTVRFDETTAVDDVSLDLEEGQVLAVLGPSGCGKSTLLRAVAGLERLDSGRITWHGRDLAGVPTHRRGFALMFQDGQLFAHASVADNIAYSLRLRGVARAARTSRVGELLELVGLPGYADRRTTTLSGGEQQRVALARALAAEPALLLLDEPLSALDRSLRERLAGDLREILTTTGTTAVMVTHDHDEAFTVADRMAVMLAGRVAQEGDTAQVWHSPVSREVAEFIGYETVLEGPAVAALLARADGGHALRAGTGGGTLALRRSALRVDAAGPLTGVVRRAVSVSDAVHLLVEVPEIGQVAARADDPVHQLGDEVRLRLDAGGIATLP
ncbi:ABC transporter ATP-binding protein [Ornithinimicrobium pratense]|uniref:ABC-type quaternary amine transporter n=1 Tax=Ornithinimicrobium pratense TaxID=2593973 RepID=A0A5J6V9J9_9MICO|nr:ABC transporter ATP-binding protein [Ornithinimicrobium pratense]QFG69712.1 ABC transporter ATP-binding protein [Ornithinimicrobium pratense]